MKIAWVFVIFVLLVTEAQAQSLDATLDWMSSTLAPRGLTYTDRNGWNYYSAAANSSYTQLITSFTHDGCRVRVVKDVELNDPALFGHSTTEYTETFDLHDLNPQAVEVPEERPWSVILNTTNGRKLIHCSAINRNPGGKFGKDAGCLPALDDAEQLRFSTHEYAQRFARAMRHAITLCGGKASTF